MNKREFNLLKKFVEKVFSKANLDSQTFDLSAYVDSSLSYYENKQIIIQKLKELGVLTKDLEIELGLISKKDLEAEERAFNEQYYEELEKWKEEKINEIRKESVKEIESYFENLYRYIEILLKSKNIKGLIVVGKRGMGKTFNTIKKLKDLGINFEIIRGHITPYELFNFLFENSEKLIVLDDIINLFDDDEILTMLLGALDKNNTIKWVSKNERKEFVFNGKIIILTNKLKIDDDYLEALKDRSYLLKLNFKNHEIIEMLYILARKRNIPLEVVDFIKEMEKVSLKNLSLRLLDKIYEIYKHAQDNWQELAKLILEYDENLEIVYELIKSGMSVKEQVKEFIERTGLSRRTYFYYKKKVKSCISL